MILQLHVHVAIVQRTDHLFREFFQLIIRHILLLVKGLKLWKILVVDGIPVQSQLFLIVPQCIALVQTIPQHLELAGIAGLGFARSPAPMIDNILCFIIFVIKICSSLLSEWQ